MFCCCCFFYSFPVWLYWALNFILRPLYLGHSLVYCILNWIYRANVKKVASASYILSVWMKIYLCCVVYDCVCRCHVGLRSFVCARVRKQECDYEKGAAKQILFYFYKNFSDKSNGLGRLTTSSFIFFCCLKMSNSKSYLSTSATLFLSLGLITLRGCTHLEPLLGPRDHHAYYANGCLFWWKSVLEFLIHIFPLHVHASYYS